MKMELTILGSGSAVPTLTRFPSSQLLNINEQYILIDCGEGAQMQMRRFGVKMQKIDHIFISHLHGDHFLGLSGYLQTLHLLGREKDIHVYGPPELEAIINIQFKSVNAQLRYTIHWHKTQNKENELLLDAKWFTVRSFPLYHKVATTGFLVEEKAKKRKYLPEEGQKHEIPVYWIDRIKRGEDYINDNGDCIPNALLTKEPEASYRYAYCSDTAFMPDLNKELPTGIDAMYHEASFLLDKKQRAKETLHSTAEDAGRQAALCHVKHLILGHFSARYHVNDQFIQEASTQYSGQISLAHDGMVFRFGT